MIGDARECDKAYETAALPLNYVDAGANLPRHVGPGSEVRPEGPTDDIAKLLARPHVRTTGEQERFWDRYRVVCDDAVPSGNLVPDAHVVALMLENDVRTIWTRDRDYRRFAGIEVCDPFS